MPNSASLRRKTRLGLVFSALVFVLIGIAVFAVAQRSIADAALVSHTHHVINRIDEIQASVLVAESSARGYELSGNLAYLSNYRDGVERLPGQFERLQALVSDNPVQLGNLASLQKLVDARLTQLRRLLEIYQRDGLEQLRKAMSPAVFQSSSSVREHVQQMIDVEKGLLVSRDLSNRRSADLLRLLALAGIPFGLGSVAVVYALLFRELHNREVAEQAASMANERLGVSIVELERSTADLNALTRYAGLLQSCKDPEEALAVTARMLAALMPVAGGHVYLLRASRDRAEAIVSWGQATVRSEATVAPEDCWALRRDKTHSVHDLRCDPACPHIVVDPHTAAASACIPLSAQGTQLGFVFLTGPGPGPLPRIAIAEAAAEQLSLALSNLRLRESLRLQSIRDPLTGLYNRRYLEESLNHELARCARRSMPLSLLMLDVDHFKRFNDLHGHSGGDNLLAAVGQMLASRLRGEDIACRYGGEEFTVILPETTPETALEIAEQLRGAAQQISATLDGKALPGATVSIGLASYSRDGVVATTLLRKADAALYRAKRSGRNRVQQFDPALDGMG